jgi:hypothetical protein
MPQYDNTSENMGRTSVHPSAEEEWDDGTVPEKKEQRVTGCKINMHDNVRVY